MQRHFPASSLGCSAQMGLVQDTSVVGHNVHQDADGQPLLREQALSRGRTVVAQGRTIAQGDFSNNTVMLVIDPLPASLPYSNPQMDKLVYKVTLDKI